MTSTRDPEWTDREKAQDYGHQKGIVKAKHMSKHVPDFTVNTFLLQ